MRACAGQESRNVTCFLQLEFLSSSSSPLSLYLTSLRRRYTLHLPPSSRSLFSFTPRLPLLRLTGQVKLLHGLPGTCCHPLLLPKPTLTLTSTVEITLNVLSSQPHWTGTTSQILAMCPSPSLSSKLFKNLLLDTFGVCFTCLPFSFVPKCSSFNVLYR